MTAYTCLSPGKDRAFYRHHDRNHHKKRTHFHYQRRQLQTTDVRHNSYKSRQDHLAHETVQPLNLNEEHDSHIDEWTMESLSDVDLKILESLVSDHWLQPSSHERSSPNHNVSTNDRPRLPIRRSRSNVFRRMHVRDRRGFECGPQGSPYHGSEKLRSSEPYLHEPVRSKSAMDGSLLPPESPKSLRNGAVRLEDDDAITASPRQVSTAFFNDIKDRAKTISKDDEDGDHGSVSVIILPSHSFDSLAINKETEDNEVQLAEIPEPKPTQPPPRFRNYQADSWRTMFKQLCDFRRTHNHSLVPHTYHPNPRLSQWVKRQRRQYKLYQEGKRSTMTQERIEELERVGFIWDSHQVAWEARYQELKEYKKKYGNCDVPSNFPQNHKLSVWVKRQRRQYKLFWNSEPSAMTIDRMGKLSDLDFSWELRRSS